MKRNRFWDFGGVTSEALSFVNPLVHHAVMLHWNYPLEEETMNKYWVCRNCLPEEVEELTIGSILRSPCVICGERKGPSEMRCVRRLPERLEKVRAMLAEEQRR